MFQILKDIYTDTQVAPFLGFKGGTAAYMFYDLPRFSVDLDFDLLDEAKEDIVFEGVVSIIKAYGQVKDAAKKRFGALFVISCGNDDRNIKIEINRRSFGSRFELKSYFGISMLVMLRGDMFANKLMAMKERLGKTNRDIFDCWFFLKNNWPVNKELVEKRSGMSFKDFLQKCIDELEKKSDRNILSGMGELLDPKQKAWAKGNLRKDAIFLLKVRRDAEL
jgi:predicted nucleotidyltransferase component of viral defense system